MHRGIIPGLLAKHCRRLTCRSMVLKEKSTEAILAVSP